MARKSWTYAIVEGIVQAAAKFDNDIVIFYLNFNRFQFQFKFALRFCTHFASPNHIRLLDAPLDERIIHDAARFAVYGQRPAVRRTKNDPVARLDLLSTESDHVARCTTTSSPRT
jgi:hypothetical protein